MKPCQALFLLLFVGIAKIADCTEQVFDQVLLNGVNYCTSDLPLRYAMEKGPLPEFTFDNSSNWKGYVAEWRIQDGKLWLSNFQATVKGKQFNIVDFLEKGPIPIHATWFSGSLDLIPGTGSTGRIGEFVTNGCTVWIEEGVVVETKQNAFRISHRGFVGIVLKMDGDRVVVSSISKNSPAERSKRIDVGDEIISVFTEGDQERTVDQRLARALCFLKGFDRTSVKLRIKKAGSQDINEVELTRVFFYE